LGCLCIYRGEEFDLLQFLQGRSIPLAYLMKGVGWLFMTIKVVAPKPIKKFLVKIKKFLESLMYETF
jgi:hypothetical protein